MLAGPRPDASTTSRARTTRDNSPPEALRARGRSGRPSPGAKSNSFVDRRDTAILRLLLDTGGRLSEVAGLAVADVDFDSDVVHVLGKGRRPRALSFGQQTGLALGR